MTQETILCIIRNKEVPLTDEEKVRQDYIKTLIEDYGYKKEDIRVEYHVKRSPSDTRKSLPVDIAVLENGEAKIFVETKKPSYYEGLEQLKSYMDFANVTYGVWTNGNTEEKGEGRGICYIEKIINNNKIEYKEIFDIPECGFYSIKEQIKKKELKPTNNLKTIFKQIRGFIAANSIGTTRDERILSELMSILICKIYDERYKTSDDYMEFIVINDDYSKTAMRIKEIFEYKIKEKYSLVFDKTEKIQLDENSITYVVTQLQRYSITESASQVVSDAFQSLIGYALKGSQGQFFTPKNVIDVMVNVIKPERHKYLLDPACGTAGFLISAMNYMWEIIENKKLEIASTVEEKKEYAMKQLFGIEKDNFLAKMAKSYMAVLGDGKSGVFIEDSLNPNAWHIDTKAEIRNNYFDYILTNPPFGKDIKLTNETKSMYKFDSVDIIFLERALELLKDGGVLGIILPETIFHSSNNQKVREELIYKHNIIALIDLPHDTFRPFNNAKCDVIFLQKNTPQQEYILTIKIDNIGHNHLGETVYKYDLKTNTFDKSSINDDTQEIISFLKDDELMKSIMSKALENNKENQGNSHVKYVSANKIIKSDLLVARNYFDPEININKAISLEQLIDEGIISYFDGHGSPQGHLKGLGEYPYIRVKDVVNLEIYINPLDFIPKFEYERLYTIKKKLKAKDIAFVRRGSYRIGDVGILYEKDLNSIFTREILILRVEKLNNKYGITSHNLLYLLNSKEVKQQLKNKIMFDTTLPNIADRWKYLYIPLYEINKMLEISNKMECLYNSREQFWEELDSIK